MSDLSRLLSIAEAMFGALCALLGSTVQDKCEHTAVSPVKGHKDE